MNLHSKTNFKKTCLSISNGIRFNLTHSEALEDEIT